MAEENQARGNKDRRKERTSSIDEISLGI